MTFIDGDDWLEKDALRRMVEAALSHNIDYVVMNMWRRLPFGTKYKLPNSINNYNIPIYPPNIINDYYITFFGINLFHVGYAGKLIKKETILKSTFEYNHFNIGEDLLFNVYLFPHVNSLIFIDYYGYNWRFGGFTSSKKTIEQTKKTILEFIELYRIKSKIANTIHFHKAYGKMSVELKNVLCANFSSIAKYAGNDNRSQPVKDLITEIINIDEYYNNICSLLNSEKYASDLFIKAIAQKDADTIYNLCHNNYKKNWKRRIAKRLLSLI